MKNLNTKNAVISVGNIEDLANLMAIRAIKTVLMSSGNEHIDRLLTGLLDDINTPPQYAEAYTDGYDIRQEVCCILLEYIGQDIDGVAHIDEKGTEITNRVMIYRRINRYIYHNRVKASRHLWLDDYCGNLLLASWCDADYYTADIICSVVDSMRLTAHQDRILRYRMKGFGVAKIARKMGISKQAVYNNLRRIGRKLPPAIYEGIPEDIRLRMLSWLDD